MHSTTRVTLPADLIRAIDKYLCTPWSDGRDPSKLGALNAVAFIGERLVAVVATHRGRVEHRRRGRRAR
jgi:hypothetical protein